MEKHFGKLKKALFNVLIIFTAFTLISCQSAMVSIRSDITPLSNVSGLSGDPNEITIDLATLIETSEGIKVEEKIYSSSNNITTEYKQITLTDSSKSYRIRGEQSENYKIIIDPIDKNQNFNITLENVKIKYPEDLFVSAMEIISGTNVKMFLNGESTLDTSKTDVKSHVNRSSDSGGILVPKGATIEIMADSPESGILNVRAYVTSAAIGGSIGSGKSIDSGKITFSGGTINASTGIISTTAAASVISAAIGSSSSGSIDDILIQGDAIVNARVYGEGISSYGASGYTPAIGGDSKYGGNITITGDSVVTAKNEISGMTAANSAAAIGSNQTTSGGTILIDGNSNVTATILVTGNSPLSLNGRTVTASNTGAAIGTGGGAISSATRFGGKITIGGNSTVNASTEATITQDDGGSAVNNGTAIGNGSIYNNEPSTILITGNSTVVAETSATGYFSDPNKRYYSRNASSAIGGSGFTSTGQLSDNITINENAHVTATSLSKGERSHSLGSAIGAGGGSDGKGDNGNGRAGDVRNILIEGNAKVFATSENGAAIGGAGGGVTVVVDGIPYFAGRGGNGGNITIGGTATVVATSNVFGAGIGGGGQQLDAMGNTRQGNGGIIAIKDSADVTAIGGVGAAGIGNGANALGAEVSISDTANVKAYGKNSVAISATNAPTSGAYMINGYLAGKELNSFKTFSPNVTALISKVINEDLTEEQFAQFEVPQEVSSFAYNAKLGYFASFAQTSSGNYRLANSDDDTILAQQSTQSLTPVALKLIIDVPTIEAVIFGATKLSGTSLPNATISILFPLPSGENLEKIVVGNNDGVWEFALTDDIKPLELGAEIRLNQTIDDVTSDDVTAVVAVRTDKPTIDNVTTGDKNVLGTGIVGAEVCVTFPNDKSVKAIVGIEGNWFVKVPVSELNFSAGETITAYQTVENNQSEDETTVIIEKSNADIDKPFIYAVAVVDEEIAGAGKPTFKITITLPNDTIETAIVDENGNWKIPVANGVLKVNAKVSAIQTNNDGKDSAPYVVLVHDKTPVPTVNMIFEGNSNVSGTGLQNHEVIIKLPNGRTIETRVDGAGNWDINVPNNMILFYGNLLSFTQKNRETSKFSDVVIQKVEKQDGESVIKAESFTIEVVDNVNVITPWTFDDILEKSKYVVKHGYKLSSTEEMLYSVNFKQTGIYGMKLTAEPEVSSPLKLAKDLMAVVVVTVVDNYAPTIEADKTISYGVGSTVDEEGFLFDINAVATDNYDTNAQGKKTINVEVIGFDLVKFDEVGEFVVKLTAIDASNNKAENVEIAVNITEDIPPVILAPQEPTVTQEPTVIVGGGGQTPDVIVDTPPNNENDNIQQENIQQAEIVGTEIPLAGGLIARKTGDNTFDIIDENGVALGSVTVPDGQTIQEMNIDELVTPKGDVAANKNNPKTGENQSQKTILLIIMSFFLIISVLCLKFIRFCNIILLHWNVSKLNKRR